MVTFTFHLHIGPEQFLEYYRGTARHVIARSTDGRTVQFPASHLQRFVTDQGVHGRFCLTCDDANRLVSLERTP